MISGDTQPITNKTEGETMTIKFQYANLLHAGSFGLNVFSPDDLGRIHLATLDVLWNVGVLVKSQQAREIFGDSGCVVDKKTDIVKIPPHLVEDAINSAPSTILLAGTLGLNRALSYEQENQAIAALLNNCLNWEIYM